MIPSKRISTALMLLIIAATWIKPINPAEQAMHGSLTVVALLLMWRYGERLQMSARDYFCIALFLSVHSIAARWLYSYVPYDAWLKSLFGVSLNASLGWTRNHFDRLVHCMFGVCFTPAIASYVLRRYVVSSRRAFLVAVSAIMIASLCYEWFEMVVALTLSEKDAEAYNGQQGDIWDAHKDMLIATLGSLAWAFVYLRRAKPALPTLPAKR